VAGGWWQRAPRRRGEVQHARGDDGVQQQVGGHEDHGDADGLSETDHEHGAGARAPRRRPRCAVPNLHEKRRTIQ
jgi:hypothetical protein